MMGRLRREQAQLFYSFSLDDAVPADHSVRALGLPVESQRAIQGHRSRQRRL
jgi:hypothetical protein